MGGGEIRGRSCKPIGLLSPIVGRFCEMEVAKSSSSTEIGLAADKPSSSTLIGARKLEVPEIELSSDMEVDDPEDSAVLLSLLALLLRSSRSLEADKLLPLPLDSPPGVVSRSNPYCSKDRLKDVPRPSPTEMGRGIWGGRLEDMPVGSKVWVRLGTWTNKRPPWGAAVRN